MLSEEAKKELLEAAASASLREDFRIMRENTSARRMTLDELVQFLTSVSRFCDARPPTRKAQNYRFPYI